ncbi:hypothetical protein G7054_g8618 [Neopestalotiopsis clavispora]|nr:hypothetical protein G7054_g8618 [Neopestalotiopsis clavispora]
MAEKSETTRLDSPNGEVNVNIRTSSGSDTEVPDTFTKQQEIPQGDKATSPPNEIVYPHGTQLVLIMASVMLNLFLAALDQTIVATAIPSITNEFHGLEKVSWYGSAYFMTFAGLGISPVPLHL